MPKLCFLLVDNFDRPKAESFLMKHGFDENGRRYFGGKPIYLVGAIQAKKIGEDLK